MKPKNESDDRKNLNPYSHLRIELMHNKRQAKQWKKENRNRKRRKFPDPCICLQYMTLIEDAQKLLDLQAEQGLTDQEQSRLGQIMEKLSNVFNKGSYLMMLQCKYCGSMAVLSPDGVRHVRLSKR
jgi:hypothetical protein